MNINLKYLPMEKLKTTTISVYIHRPLNKADASKNAVLPYVLRQGCKLCRDYEEVSKYLENLYGAALGSGVEKIGDDQALHFEAETIADKYAPNNEALVSELLKLMLSVIFEPVTEDNGFRKSILDVEKNNAKNRIMSVMNDKRHYAIHRCTEEMCAGENYAVSKYGDIEGVDAITAQGLYEYYRDIITSSVIDIYVCGIANENELNKIIEDMTKDLDFAGAEIPSASIHINDGEIKNIAERMNVTQGKLSIGFTTDIKPSDADIFALIVMNSIFGAGAHSKLFNNVREKLSLAYYASSNLVKAKGIMFVNAGIEFDNYQKAYDEILAQLKEIQNANITETEFNSGVSAILNLLESYKDNASALCDFAVRERILGTNYELDYVKSEIQKVTIDDVVRVSKSVKADTVYFLSGKGEN